jgi:hypothetical protein
MTDGNEREHETKHELAEDDEQIIQNLTMTSRWFSISVGHACSSFGITGPDDNLELLDTSLVLLAVTSFPAAGHGGRRKEMRFRT